MMDAKGTLLVIVRCKGIKRLVLQNLSK